MTRQKITQMLYPLFREEKVETFLSDTEFTRNGLLEAAELSAALARKYQLQLYLFEKRGSF